MKVATRKRPEKGRKERLHVRFDPVLLEGLDKFCDRHGLARTWVLEQSVRLLIELVEAREQGERIIRVGRDKVVRELLQLHAVPL